MGSRVRTQMLTHFHFISSFEILSLAVMSLEKWVADSGTWVAGYELSLCLGELSTDFGLLYT